jgi:hypothetical protein
MLNKIKFSYREADKQEGLFTPCHTLFKCKIKIDGLQYTFPFQCNTAYNEPNLEMCLNAILLDASCYENCEGLLDFCTEFGYNEDKKGLKAYKACKKTYKALHRLFTDEELNTLYEEVSDC